MTRLRRTDAYTPAANEKNARLSPLPYWHEHEDRKIPPTPEKPLEITQKTNSPFENFSYEIPSVWEVLLQAEEQEGNFFIHPINDIVLIFNREYGNNLGNGLLCFGVFDSVFENAVHWAMRTPSIEKDFDFYSFILKLNPRIHLRSGHWKHDPELMRHSYEIASEFAKIFELDCPQMWNVCEGLHAGKLLDLILEKVYEDITENGCNKLQIDADVRETLKYKSKETK